jgi:hypothetical protein
MIWYVHDQDYVTLVFEDEIGWYKNQVRNEVPVSVELTSVLSY